MTTLLRVVVDPRVAVAIHELADALDAHVRSIEQPWPRATGAPTLEALSEPVVVTDDHRRQAERRLRRLGVLR